MCHQVNYKDVPQNQRVISEYEMQEFARNAGTAPTPRTHARTRTSVRRASRASVSLIAQLGYCRQVRAVLGVFDAKLLRHEGNSLLLQPALPQTQGARALLACARQEQTLSPIFVHKFHFFNICKKLY
jgi:hypothetical protein